MPGDGDLDLVRGCVYGACLGTVLNPATASSKPECEGSKCVWQSGRYLSITTVESAGQPVITGFFLRSGFPATTKTGIGVGASMRCFVEDLGWPENHPFAWISYMHGPVDAHIKYGHAESIALHRRGQPVAIGD